MRRIFSVPVPLLALPALLASCAIGANFTPMTSLERATNGIYEGVGTGITGRVPYRLTLTVRKKAGRADAVLDNLESHKTYTGTGTFKRGANGAELDLNFYEGGDSFRAALHTTLNGDQMTGQLKTVLLGREIFPYNISLKKVP